MLKYVKYVLSIPVRLVITLVWMLAWTIDEDDANNIELRKIWSLTLVGRWRP
jgi:hypothetical protein